MPNPNNTFTLTGGTILHTYFGCWLLMHTRVYQAMLVVYLVHNMGMSPLLKIKGEDFYELEDENEPGGKLVLLGTRSAMTGLNITAVATSVDVETFPRHCLSYDL